MATKTVWGNTEDGLFEFVTLTEDLLDEALEICKNDFCIEESVSICTDVAIHLQAREEISKLCGVTAKDGISIVAVEKSTGKVVAAVFNKIQIKPKPDEIPYFLSFGNETCKHESSKAYMELMNEIDSIIDFFENYNTDCILELTFLMTQKDYRGKTLGEGICRASLQLAELQAKGEYVIPNYENIKFGAVAAVCSSNISRHILVDKMKFDCLMELSTEEFDFNGRKYSDKIPEQKSYPAVGKKIK